MGRRSQVVRQRSAKPLSAGSIPAVASNFSLPSDFSFPSTVESHGWYLLAPFRWEKGILHRPEMLPGGPVDLEIRARRSVLEVRGAPPSEALSQRIGRMFQLTVDLADFHRLAADSDPHRWVVDAKFGRLLCGSTLWEDAVKIITTTNTTWGQTKRMVALLVEKCGRRTPSGSAAFPEPDDVARFSPEELQQDCRLGYRAKSVHSLAAGILDGTFDLAAISNRSQSTAELYRAYQQLPGIGPYGAAHLLAMDGRHEFIAVDSEFRRFVRETYHGGRTVSDKAMVRRYAKWGRWKYLAYWSELWDSVADAL